MEAKTRSFLIFAFMVGAVLCMVVAFASPYWVQSFEEAHSRFVKLGLWESCFNDYTFYKDYKGKRYLGCFYIFSDTMRPIWEWISPPWFIAVQVMVSVTLLIQVLTGFLVVIIVLKLLPKELEQLLQIAAAMALFLCVALIFITLIVFGVYKEDRRWVPRPDMNYLSWSYGLCCISGITTLITAVLLLRQYKDTKYAISYGQYQTKY